jgi:hypothetical protein
VDKIADQLEISEGSGSSGSLAAVDDEPDEASQCRSRARWAYAGFGLGILGGFVVTAIQVASSGYQLLPFLCWNLIWAPYLGLIMGHRLGRGRRASPLKWKRPQLRTRTLMVVVAYVALLFGTGLPAERLGNTARKYFQNWATADSMAKIYRQLGQKSESNAKLRSANVAELHAGKIPEGLHPGQKDFLRSLDLDPKVTPEFREYRRRLITEGEEQTRTREEHNVAIFRGLVEYHDQLAAKYDRARWRPWLPVEPDPPLPPTQ